MTELEDRDTAFKRRQRKADRKVKVMLRGMTLMAVGCYSIVLLIEFRFFFAALGVSATMLVGFLLLTWYVQ